MLTVFDGCASKTLTTTYHHPEAPSKITSQDGAEMILVPAGPFVMGSNEAHDEQPLHTVYTDAFYIDSHEVTNAQYQKFLSANQEWRKDVRDWRHDGDYLRNWDGLEYPERMGEHPVVCVTWYAAEAYCNWAGKRLPTEAEWEKSARAGMPGARYPHGDALYREDANYGGIGDRDVWQKSAPVKSFPPNGYGLYDMAGNALEWCADWYQSNYYRVSPKSNPRGPANRFEKVLRGGAWGHPPFYLRTANREHRYPVELSDGIGFRCVMDTGATN